ncbi:MAG: TIGR02206 family membrane protein [Myxococcota bacterium]
MTADAPPPGFVAFGRTHLLILAGIVVISAVLPWWALRAWSPEIRLWVARGLALVLAGSVWGWTILKVRAREFNPTFDLPIDLCNLLAVLAPFYAWRPSLETHEITYYMVMAGTLMAVLTPDLRDGFPHRNFVKYWVVHAGLIVLVIYITAALGLFPTPRGIVTAFLTTLAYIPIAALLNWRLGANYAYVSAKPDQPSLLDVLGPWPWYIFGALAIGLGMFGLFYLPFYFIL